MPTKENADIFGSYICYFFNDSVERGDFPSILKLANIAPVFKKGFKGSKDNYRPVSILPVISKIFEACKQITFFIDPLLSNFQCDFGKGFGAQSEVDKRHVWGTSCGPLESLLLFIT